MDRVNARILARRDTTEHWNENRLFVPMKGEVIIYTDHGKIDDGYGNLIDVPGIKIGDGNAYLIDLPFVGNDVRYEIMQEIRNHEDNHIIHITQEEREYWNNKLDSELNGETLVLAPGVFNI